MRTEIESYIRYILASAPQPRDKLENRRSTNDKMSKRMWEKMENRKIDKAGMEKARGIKEERRKREVKGKEREERRV